jgi:hypothetical protein
LILRRAIPVVLDIHSAPGTFKPAFRGKKKARHRETGAGFEEAGISLS